MRTLEKLAESYFSSMHSPKEDIPPVLNAHIGSQSSDDWLRHTRAVLGEATPASGSAGQPPKAPAHSRGDGLCQHTRHQQGTPACGRV